MPTQEEKTAFAQRLQIALNRSAVFNHNVKAIKGATDLARQFNLRHTGKSGISMQTAHKWLTGRTIPTNDKIKTLAEWLEVTEHWLHYGPPPNTSAPDIKKSPLVETATLINKIQALPTQQCYLVEELITQLLKICS